MQIRETTREERAQHVARMVANFAIEDLHPQADDVVLQKRYIDGEITLDDMHQHARKFALKCAHSET